MLEITQRRGKCIGCHACVEAAPHHWKMSAKDGKAVLLHAKLNRGGVYIIRVPAMDYDANKKAADACPVKIIKLKLT